MNKSAAFQAGAAAFRQGHPRACPIAAPSTFPGSAESRAWAQSAGAWYAGWDSANISEILVP